MTSDQARPRTDSGAINSAIAVVAGLLARYGLALVIGWIGALKFTSYEANGIQPLMANSPLMSWLYNIFTVNTFSALLGVVEITTAVLLCVKPWWPRISMVGSVMAIGLFLGSFSPHPAWVKHPQAGFRCCRLTRVNSSSKMLRCWASRSGLLQTRWLRCAVAPTMGSP